MLISGVTDEVAQVSITSVSGTNSLHLQFGHSFILGFDVNGFTGRSSSVANTGFPQSLQYQTGNGTPKYLCLEIHQSHMILLTHSLYLFCMYEGCQLISLPIFKKSSLWFMISINHCFITEYSTSFPHLSWVWTSCSSSSTLTKAPALSKSSTTFWRASLIFKPP